MYWEKKINDGLVAVKNIVDEINDKESSRKSNMIYRTKNPDTNLQWVQDSVINNPVYHMNISVPDKKLYGEMYDGTNHRIFKYGEFGNASTFEMGIESRNTMQGIPRFIHVTPDYVIYVTSREDDSNVGEKTWIYKAPDINTTPTLITENESGIALEMSCHAYYDGFTDIILVGIYGKNPKADHPRDLLMSVDGGETFNLIKQTTIVDNTVNTHWHAVWFDHYQGRIWASEGDGANRNLHYTDDYGVTWTTIDGSKPEEGRHQPTLIFGWGERVLFGRDANYKRPGFDSYERVFTTSDREEEQTVIDKYTSRIDTIAAVAYPRRGIAYTDNGEAYAVIRSADKDSVQIIATGDWGRSWQCVHASKYSSARLSDELTGMTHEGYLCGRVSSHGSIPSARLVYAKKLNWDY